MSHEPQPPMVGRQRSVWHWFVRTFFRLLYHEMAWTYDLVAWLVSLGQWKAWGRAALTRLHGQHVLELGHGPGHLLVAMHRAGLAPVGLDLSPQMGKLARERLHRGGALQARLPLVRARAQELPFRSGAFDSVVSTFPTEFIFDLATLQQVARVMKPQGRAVVVMGVVFQQGLPARLLKWLYAITFQDEPAPPGVANVLEQAGLTLEHDHERMGMVDVLMIIARKR